ncbi:hypothetical protein H8E07_10765 [bacterium]|nr:hypothetical protein [bacterium]
MLPAAICLAALLWPVPSSAIECLTHRLPQPDEPYAETRARLEAAGQWAPAGTQARSVPADPQLGDTWDWYIWDLGGMPVATLKPCTIRGLGDNVFVVVDDDEWNVGGMDQAAVDRIVSHFENQSLGDFPDQGIWDLNTSHFGDPPNPLDQQDRIFLLYYRFDISSDGYFWSFDQYPDGSTAWSSNEADVVYLATDNGDPGGDYMLAVAAHEFEHLIHFDTDQNEEAWVDEGLAELAMWLFGHPDHISSFNTNPDNSLTSWGSAWADYIQTYLWSLYIYEQFGGQPTIWDVSHQAYNGMTGYERVLADAGYAVPIEQVFANWTVANYLDDPSLYAGQFGYTGEVLPAFNPWRTHTELPAAGAASLQSWAGEYVRLTNLDEVGVYTFDGNDARDFRVNLIALDPALPTLVESLPLDALNDGILTFAAAAGYDEAIIGVANVYPGASGIYNYDVELYTTPVAASPNRAVVLHCRPNPFNPSTELSFRLPAAGYARLQVHDSRGRLAAVLQEGRLPAGEHRFVWNVEGLASGTYFASVEIDGALGAVETLSLVR